MDWLTLLDKILPLIGVVLGALLVPFYGHVVEKRKLKRRVKIELFQTITSFYMYHKLQVSSANYTSLYSRAGSLVWYFLRDMAMDDPQRLEFERQHKSFSELSILHSQQSNEYVKCKIDRTSKLIEQLFLIRELYGHKRYAKMDDVTKLMQDENVHTTFLYKYHKLSLDEINKIMNTIEDLLEQKQDDINTQLQRILIQAAEVFE